MIDVCASLPEALERGGSWVKNDEAAVALHRRHVPVVAQTEFEGDVRPPLVIRLDEEAERSLGDAVRLIAQRNAEGVGGSGEKCGHAGKIECPGAEPEIVVEELPEFAADLQGVPPAQAAQHVGNDESRVASSRREDGWAAKVEGPTGNVDLRQSNWLGDTVADPEIGGVEQRIRFTRAGKAVDTEARLIDPALPEGMRLVQREEL